MLKTYYGYRPFEETKNEESGNGRNFQTDGTIDLENIDPKGRGTGFLSSRVWKKEIRKTISDYEKEKK